MSEKSGGSLLTVPVSRFDEEIARRGHLADPVGWITSSLNDRPWSVQREICESVRDNRRTAVRSCNTAGKSFIAARITAWWIVNHKAGEAFVVTSATTDAQVVAVLWREINRTHSRGNLVGRTNLKQWWLPMPEGHEEMVAFGRKPSDDDPTAFQGIHAKYVLVIFDEAGGIPKPLWVAADSLIGNKYSRFLAIGNPDEPDNEFAEVCKPGGGWNVIGISAFDTPNFTGEEVSQTITDSLVSRMWQEEMLAKEGEESPYYISKVLGRFPKVSTGGLIPHAWIEAAQKRELAEGEPNELGVDVGAGGDYSSLAHRRGGHVRVLWRDRNPDTMQTCGKVLATLRETGATVVKVDKIGIGKGIFDRGLELGKPIRGINVGLPARDSEQFRNLRAEGYWALRERFQAGDIDIDPDDAELAAQLADIKYKRNSRGQIVIELKEEMKRRMGRSPDDADAVMLAFISDSPVESQELLHAASATVEDVKELDDEIAQLERDLGVD